ncbi:MAG TPA: hypothetical protein VL242_41820, partial [Sorangium sp.]|nr:hypothetical protein [Sorangium sp.]
SGRTELGSLHGWVRFRRRNNIGNLSFLVAPRVRQPPTNWWAALAARTGGFLYPFQRVEWLGLTSEAVLSVSFDVS